MNSDLQENIEIHLYSKFLCQEVVHTLSRAIDKRGTTNDYKYSVKATRASGSPVTSIGNSMINIVATIRAWCRATGCTVQEAPSQMRVMVLGDDNVLLSKKPLNLNHMTSYYHDLGIDIKIDNPSIDDVEFCNCRFWPVNGLRYLGSKPGRLFSKMFFSSQQEALSRNVYADARGILACYGFVPIVGDVMRWLLESPLLSLRRLAYSKKKAKVIEEYMFHNSVAPTGRYFDGVQSLESVILMYSQPLPIKPSYDTYEYLAKLYGIDQEMVTQLVAELSLKSDERVVLGGPIVELMLRKDVPTAK
jgi:hypothetical protein